MKNSELTNRKALLTLLACLGFVFLSHQISAQCRVFSSGFISATETAPIDCTPKQVGTCILPLKNVSVTGLVANEDYTLRLDGGHSGYATIYHVSDTRNPVASGSGEITFRSTSSGDYIIAVSGDALCSNDHVCRTIEIIKPHPHHCGEPSKINITPTANGATITWNPGVGAYQYNVVWRLAGTTTNLGNSSGSYGPGIPSVTVTGLQPCQDYEFWIYETCCWISTINGPYPFTTGGNVCPDPTNLSASNITTTTADINWTPGANSQTYTVVVGFTGFGGDLGVNLNNPPTLLNSDGFLVSFTGTVGVDGPPVTITGLFDKESYDIYVYEDCGNCGESGVLGPITIMTLPIPGPPADTCLNGGFETGMFTQWAGTFMENTNGGSSPFGSGLYITGFGLDVPGNILNSRHSLMPDANWTGTGNDPLLATGGINVPIISPFGGANSARLGNPQDGRGAESLEKTFLVNLNTATFYYAYALVLEDSHNPASTQAFFTVRFFDQNCNPILDGMGSPVGVTHNGGAQDALMTQLNVNGNQVGIPMGGSVFYRNWTCAFVDLTAFIGQEVTVEFTTSDCSQGAHFGYAYIDDVCTDCSGNGGSSGGSLTACVDSCGPAPINVWGSFTPPFVIDGNGNQINGTPADVLYSIYQTNGGTPTLISGPTSVGTGVITGQNFNFQIPASAFPTVPPAPDGFDIVVEMVFSINGGTVTVQDGTPGQGLKQGVDNDVMLDCGTGCPDITPAIGVTAILDYNNNTMIYTFTDQTTAAISHIEWIVDGVDLTEMVINPFATTTPPGIGQFGPFPPSFQVGDNPGTSIELTYSPMGIHEICLVTFYYVGGQCCHDTTCIPFGCVHTCQGGNGKGRRVSNFVDETGAVVYNDIIHNPVGDVMLSAIGSEGMMDVVGTGGNKLVGFKSLVPPTAFYESEIVGLDLKQDGDRIEAQIEGQINGSDLEVLGTLHFEKNGEMVELAADFNKLNVSEVLIEVRNHGKVSTGKVSTSDIAAIKGLSGVSVLRVNTDDKNQTKLSFVANGKIMVFTDAFNAMGHEISITLLEQKPLHHIDGVNYLTSGSNEGFTIFTEEIRESLEEGECYAEVYEPNDVRMSAYPVFPRFNKSSLVNARLCNANDVDWYTFEVSKLSKEAHTITLFNLSKDYNLEVFDAEGVRVATGNGVAEKYEKAELDNLPIGTYYVKVFSRNGSFDQVKGYSLEVKESGNMSEAGLAHYRAQQVRKTYGFSIYPNPSNGMVNVGFESVAEGQVAVKVYDIFGKLMQTSEKFVQTCSTELTLDLSNLNAGTYLIQVSQDGRSQTGKVVLAN